MVEERDSMKLYSRRVYTASGCKAATIEIEGGRIVSVAEGACPADAVDYGEMRIIPGIFDTHNHGTSGFDLMETGADFSERKAIVRGYLKGLAAQGTVNIFPTVSDAEGIRAVAEVARETVDGANVLGIHSEGPWLSRVGEKGVRTPWPEVSIDAARELVEAGGGMLRLMALAPEIPGIDEVIDYLLGAGVTVAAAHSDNTYEAAHAAYGRGISVATHTGNVMTDMHHRDIGGLGAALTDSRVMCEVICDGMHICNDMLGIYFRIKDYGHFMMISDCTALSGAEPGVYDGGGLCEELRVTKDGFVLTETGRLMGSSQPVLFGIGNLVNNVGVSLETCLEMACLNPAIMYGFADHKGTIEPGKDADLVVIDDGYHALATYACGRKVYDRAVDGRVFNHAYLSAHRKKDEAA